MRNRLLNLLAVAVVAGLVSGCSSASGVKTQVSTFQSSSAVVMASARDEFTGINQVVRDAYIDRQLAIAQNYVANGTKVDPVTEKQGFFDSTTLAAHEVLSPAALSARLDALNALSRYGELLNSLANSDADTRIAQEANDLGASLTNLNKTLTSIDDLDTNQNKAFADSVGAFTTVFVPIATAIVNHRIQEAIDSAVVTADPKVSELIAAIRNDLHSLSVKNARTLKDALDDANVNYLDLLQQKGCKASDLAASVDVIKAKLNAVEAFSTVNTDNALDAMASAEKALVNYAKSKKTAVDLANFAAAMDAFAGQAQILAAAIQDVRAATDALNQTQAKSKKAATNNNEK